MTRRVIVLLMVLGIGLQGPAVAYTAALADAKGAGCALMVDAGYGYGANQAHGLRHSCCPGGTPAMGCCASLMAVAITSAPAVIDAHYRVPPPLVAVASTYLSHGDSPLIRPPII